MPDPLRTSGVHGSGAPGLNGERLAVSDVAADNAERLNIREQIARIDRALDEAAKFRSERIKLDAEAAKFRRERFFAPAVALAATLGAIAALVPFILRALG